MRNLGDDELLCCPQCGSTYGLHLTSVRVATEEGVVTVNSKVTMKQHGASKEQAKAVERRGNRLYLEYNCEQSHYGYIVFQFHKGQITIEHERLNKPVNDFDIWRD
jgi:hypothetical protein